MNKNDIVYTPNYIAKKIIDYFNPSGEILEPCRGKGAFTQYMPECDWCEIQDGKDFFCYTKHVDWIISNPPFSIYDQFLQHAFRLADNVVYLIPLYKTFKSKKQQQMVDGYGGLKTVLIIGSGNECGFNMGFLCGCVHYKRNYNGLVKVDKLWK